MSSKYGCSTLSGLVDSESEGEKSHVETMPAASGAKKKARGRPKGSGQNLAKAPKVMKSKPPARRTIGRSNRSIASAEEQKDMKAPAENSHHQYPSDTEDVDDFDQDEHEVISRHELDDTRTGALSTMSATTRASRTKPTSGNSTEAVLGKEVTVKERKTTSCATKKKARTKQVDPVDSPEKIIMETQIPVLDMDVDEGTNEEVEGNVAKLAWNPQPRPDNQGASVQSRRPGSASDPEQNDPSIRRKLGDITKKFVNLELKYQDLREISVKEAERNFERYKKQSEQKTIAANNLIASLKADVTSQSGIAKEARSLQRKFDAQSSEMAKLQAQIFDLTSSVDDLKLEKKALSTKLAAHRTVAASIESTHSKIQESAKKANGATRMVGSAEAAQVAQTAQLKEDLYSDLSGLIIRGVKRGDEEDIFDCIQTGRNGTLHFKLGIANEKSANSYDDAQCIYTPRLDDSRDKELKSLLPSYLSEEIIFPRPQAARFYARVMKALTEKSTFE